MWGFHLSSAQLQGVSLAQTGGAFYHRHLFPADGEEHHPELLREPTDQLTHLAEKGGGLQGEV